MDVSCTVEPKWHNRAEWERMPHTDVSSCVWSPSLLSVWDLSGKDTERERWAPEKRLRESSVHTSDDAEDARFPSSIWEMVQNKSVLSRQRDSGSVFTAEPEGSSTWTFPLIKHAKNDLCYVHIIAWFCILCYYFQPNTLNLLQLFSYSTSHYMSSH